MTDETARGEGGGAMELLDLRVYRGPHLFGLAPMAHVRLDLGALAGAPPGWADAVAARVGEGLPGLDLPARPEGDGAPAWFAQVAGIVAVGLQAAAGADAGGSTAQPVPGRPGEVDLLVGYREAEVGLLATRFALDLLLSAMPPGLAAIKGLGRLARGLDSETFEFESAVEELRELNAREGLGPTSLSLAKAAEARGIPVLRLDAESFLQLGWGARQQRLRASITGRTSHLAVEAASDKDLTKELLGAAGVPVPRGEVVRSAEGAVRAAERVGYPVVTKPLDGNHGRGVSVDLRDEDQVLRAFDEAERHGSRVIVESYFVGRDHRVLVVGGKVVAVSERVPAHVVGDGRGTIGELVDEANRDPRRGEGHDRPMTRIKLDDHALDLLAKAGLDADSVPGAGQVVTLRDTANLSTGGMAIDRTDDIHPDNALIARRAALAVGLDVAGIDMVLPDITRSAHETGGGVVEVNAAPGFRMHLAPSQGTPRDVAGPVLDLLFPGGAPARIPVFAVTGTNGKSTTCRMLAHILEATGAVVGLTSTSGVYVGKDRVAEWDASGPRSARMLLRDPLVEAAVMECARGGILREGLGFDSCDVGAVLNVQPDHLGLGGVETVEDLARVKGVVARSVRPGGHVVLNADDPLVAAMAEGLRGQVAWFSARGHALPEVVKAHIDAGGLAAVREPGPRGGTLVLHRGGERVELMRAAEIPATKNGVAGFNVLNALAAALAAFAHGMRPEVIAEALSGFDSTFEQCPGRLNLAEKGGVRIVLDYAHNPAGLEALGEAVRGLRPPGGRAIGMVNIPGDRRDADMLVMGQVAAGIFDEIVFREDPARRGRKPGEIVAHLLEGALAAGFPANRIACALEEDEAAHIALGLARPGDLVVLTPTDVDAMWRLVQGWEPVGLVPLDRDGAPAAERGAA